MTKARELDIAMGEARRLASPLCNGAERVQVIDQIDGLVGEWERRAGNAPRSVWPDVIVDASGYEARRRLIKDEKGE